MYSCSQLRPLAKRRLQIDLGSVCANICVQIIVISERSQLQNKHCKHSITPTEMHQVRLLAACMFAKHVCMFVKLVCMFVKLVCMFVKLVSMSGRKIELWRRGPIPYENLLVFDTLHTHTYVPKTNPITPPERVSLCYSKTTLSRHNPISWELQSVLLDASVLQLQLSSTQLSLVCLRAGSRTTCRSRLHSRFRLPPSL